MAYVKLTGGSSGGSSDTYLKEDFINLFDNVTYFNYIITATGSTSSTGAKTTDFLPVESADIFIYASGGVYDVALYNTSKTFIQTVTPTLIATNTRKITIDPNTVKFVRVNFHTAALATLTVSKKQISSHVAHSETSLDIQTYYKPSFVENIFGEGVINANTRSLLNQFLNEMGVKPISGLKWYQLGDSLTDWAGTSGYRNGDPQQPYLYGFGSLIQDKEGCIFNNWGTAGASWEFSDNTKTATDEPNQAIAKHLNIPDDVDIITFMYGSNCYTEGEITDSVSYTMCGAMNLVLQNVIARFPTKRIGIVLPPQRGGAATNAVQKGRNDKIKAIAQKHALPILDLYNDGRILPNYVVAGNNTLTDELHLDQNGVQNLSRRLGSFLKTL